MPLRELLRTAFGALRAHKLRSFLTTLGVVIAVWTIVSVLSVISGMNNFVMTRLFSLSPDVFFVSQFGIITSREAFFEALKRKGITIQDVERMKELCESCAEVGQLMSGGRDVHAQSRRIGDVPIDGTSANFAELQGLDLEAGRFFTEGEDRSRAPVAVIGSEIRAELFPRVDPIGRTIWIADLPHRVIGLLVKQGQVLGQSPDLVVYVPFRDAEKFLGRASSRPREAQVTMLVRARGGVASVTHCQEEVVQVFRWLRHTPLTGADPVGIVTAEAIQTLWNGISMLTRFVLWFISGISLVVGGIVVANIMLVSVVERTKEIGLRLAMGARKRDVRRQFLLEAVLLALAGGAVGTGLGALTAVLVDAQSPFPALIEPSIVALALVLAGLSGVLAGFFPARKAAAMPPVEALRHE